MPVFLEQPKEVAKFMPATPGPVCACAVSIIVPFYNEAECAKTFIDELQEMTIRLGTRVEILLVDDGSNDGTGEILEAAASQWDGCRVIHLASNRGQGAALYHGLRCAKGEILVTMDGDGQNVPADLPRMLRRIKDADMVAGVRQNREDSLLRRKMSKVANAVRRRVLADGVTDTGCGLKVFRRQVVEAFVPIRTLYSFMPALAVAGGFRVVEEPVQHRARAKGTSKYGLRAMCWRPLLDMAGVWWFTRRRFATTGLSPDCRS